MIEVRFSTSDRREISLTVKGHAGQAESGKDIVCSAASILAYTVAQIVTYADRCGKLKDTPQIHLNDGDAVIVCSPKELFETEIYHTFHVAQVGYDLLAHNYPQYVKLSKFLGA